MWLCCLTRLPGVVLLNRQSCCSLGGTADGLAFSRIVPPLLPPARSLQLLVARDPGLRRSLNLKMPIEHIAKLTPTPVQLCAQGAWSFLSPGP